MMIKLLTEMFEILTEMFMILLEMLVILTQSTKPSLTWGLGHYRNFFFLNLFFLFETNFCVPVLYLWIFKLHQYTAYMRKIFDLVAQFFSANKTWKKRRTPFF